MSGELVAMCIAVSAFWLLVCLMAMADEPESTRRRWARWALLTPVAPAALPGVIIYHICRGIYRLWEIADVSSLFGRMKPPAKMKKDKVKVKEIRRYFCAKCGSPMSRGPFK